MQGLSITQLVMGQKASFSKTVSEADIYMFAGVSGDFNPAHINQEAAEASRFKQRIAHGVLTASFISTVIGMHLPGPGSIYLEQSLKFKAPVFIGDTIKATVEVIELILEKNKVCLKTICINQKGIVVLEGEALVMPPKV
ncbi:MaoC family dehydratase [Thiotrichales bacterium 19S9-12]|nr:MaoC family dehydratase [Thiotrichales bacterium 19S9-11]MCF6811114.1 MaoC family dehydratase [Thiotrichales bacterium 19S9-12]